MRREAHAEGGTIFAQLAHSRAGSHPDFFSGALPLAPSAINPGLRGFTRAGFKETAMPSAMTRNARTADFDGLTVHAVPTYLLSEFLNSALNVREDEYGGGPRNRAHIVLEIVETLTKERCSSRVGVKISPPRAMGRLRTE